MHEEYTEGELSSSFKKPDVSEKVIQQAMKNGAVAYIPSLSAERMWKTVLGNAMHT